MIAGVVTVWIVTEIGRCPAIGGVANITLLNGIQMVNRLRCRTTIGYMTTITVTDTAGIMDPYATDKSCGGMAVMTIQCSIEMGRVDLCVLAFCCGTVMAGLAIINDAGVIECCTGKCSSSVAGTTVLIGCQMTTMFAGSKSTIMTGYTIADDASVIKCPGHKSGRLMTYAAVVISRYMIRWRCFTARSRAIMT